MPVEIITEQTIVNLFRDECRDHTAIKWFEQGSPDFSFDSQDDVQTPLVYMQTISATETNDRLSTYQFTLYCLAQPATSSEVNNSNFEWDNRYVTARDACKAHLRDIICEVKVRNRQTMTITNTGSLVHDGDSNTNFVGWRQTVDVTFTSAYDSANFPTTP